MKYADGPSNGPPMPRSSASLAQRTASMITPAELGESHTSSLSSTLSGTSPKFRPSRRMYAHLRSGNHGTWSDGPMCQAPLLIPGLAVLRTDRQVRHEHVGPGITQCLRDVDRRGRRLLDDLAVVLAQPVEGRTALHLDAELGDVGELHRVVRVGEDRLAEVDTDLGRV